MLRHLLRMSLMEIGLPAIERLRIGPALTSTHTEAPRAKLLLITTTFHGRCTPRLTLDANLQRDESR